MKILDKIGLVVFSNLILILSVLMCLVIFGWLDIESVYFLVKLALADNIITNILLALAVILIILAIKCIFFTSEEKKINGIKEGILLKNDDGELVISKTTLQELVNSVARGFDSAKDINSTIIMDNERNLKVYVTLSVKENAIIKELSTNLQAKIKEAIKKTSDLEVKEVNISVRELQPENNQNIE